MIPFDLTPSTGSARHKYCPTKCELKQGQQSFHNAITAMKEYSNVSMEELRYEDYIASKGLFGSNIANLCGGLFADPSIKPCPHVLGTLFNSTAARCQFKAKCDGTMTELTDTKENDSEQETQPKNFLELVEPPEKDTGVAANVFARETLKFFPMPSTVLLPDVTSK